MKIKKYFRWQDNKNILLAIKDRVVSIFYGLMAWYYARSVSLDSVTEEIDVLVLYRSEKGRRYPWLIEQLSDVSVHEAFIPKKQSIIKNRNLYPVPTRVGLDFYLYAAYAYYIVRKYRPKVILIDVNGSKYTPFLRQAINSVGGKLAHVAHSIPTSNYRKFHLTDFDYAFVYGQSSVDAINAMSIRYGNTKCVISGSIIVGNLTPDVQKVHDERFCVLLGSGPSFESKGRVAGAYRSMIQWAKDNPDIKLYFKPHPRSDKSLWNDLVLQLGAESIVGVLTSMSECKGADFAVAAYTNAVLDVADLDLPVVWIADKSEVDHFELESYFLPRVSDPTELDGRVGELLSNLDLYRANAKAFRTYHLGDVRCPTKFVANALKSMVNSSDDFLTVDV